MASRSGQSTIVSIAHPAVSACGHYYQSLNQPKFIRWTQGGTESGGVGLARPVPYRPSGVLTGACITAHSIAPACAPGGPAPPIGQRALPAVSNPLYAETPLLTTPDLSHHSSSVTQIDPDGNQADLIRQDLNILRWAAEFKERLLLPELIAD